MQCQIPAIKYFGTHYSSALVPRRTVHESNNMSCEIERFLPLILHMGSNCRSFVLHFCAPCPCALFDPMRIG
eukprot:76162-Amphidinium_carterae.1